MSLTRNRIVSQLQALGLQPGDRVIVHSAYKRIGDVAGGPRAVIEALAELLLPDGALLFPNLNIPHEFTAANPPRFDLKRAPVRQSIGIIPELFKFEYATDFSIHPTHSLMGLGQAAKELLSGHETSGYCCGRGTPWHKNALAGGKILLIGVNQHCNTSYHCAEELSEPSYQLTAEPITGVVVVDGREIVVASRLHVWGHHPEFDVLNPELAARGHLVTGPVGNAPTMCLHAGGFLELALTKLKKNPHYFLECIA